MCADNPQDDIRERPSGLINFIKSTEPMPALTEERWDEIMKQASKPIRYRPRTIIVSPRDKIILDVHNVKENWITKPKPWRLRLRDAKKSLRSWMYEDDYGQELGRKWTPRKALCELRRKTHTVLTEAAKRELQWSLAELDQRRKEAVWGVKVSVYPEVAE
jgi:hypothetical protein